MDELDRMFRRLVQNIKTGYPESLTHPFEVAELYQNLIPYRHNRKELALDTNQDYELTLMRLISGERGYLAGDEEMQETLTRELSSRNPDTGAFRAFEQWHVAITTDGLRHYEETLSKAPEPARAPLAEPKTGATMRAPSPMAEPRSGPSVPPAAARAVSAAPPPPAAHPGADPLAATVVTPKPVMRPAAQAAPPAPAVSSAPPAPPPVAAPAPRPAPAGHAPPAPPAAPPVPRVPAAPPSPPARAVQAASSSTSSAPMASQQRTITADALGGRCRYCDGTLPTGRAMTFCPHCGQNLTVIHCPACNSELEVGWKFCVTCGRGLDEH